MTLRRWFCYNKKMKAPLPAAVFAILALVPTLRAAMTAPDRATLDALLAGMQSAFAARDLEAYASAFAPEIRDRERQAADAFLNERGMASIVLRRTDRLPEREGGPELFLQVLYQSDTRAMLENWRVELSRSGDGWRIGTKELTGALTTLYKIVIPSGPAERARRVTVRQEDIEIVFENAWVFHDNLPDLETALLIVGKGSLRFSPSDEIERHQLELRYGRTVIEDGLENAFLRGSDDFFRSNVVIEPGPAGPSPASQTEINRAYSLFTKYYPRSFTIENSLTSGLLSFLPRGGQAVVEMQTRRTGELSYIYSPFSEDEITLVRRDREPQQIINLYTPRRPAAAGREMFISFGEKFHVQGYDIEADYEPARLYLAARARVTVQAQIDGVDSLNFSFNPALDIVRVFDQDNRELFFTQDKFRKLLYVYLLKPLGRDKAATVEVYYRGVLEIPPAMTDVVAGGQINEMLILPRYETYMYSQSSHWYPAPVEQDYFQARLLFSVPPGYFVLTNGVLVEESTVDSVRRVAALDKVGNRLYRYETRNPVKYLTFITGVFERFPVRSAPGGPDIRGFAASDVRSSRRNLAEEARAVLDCFTRWFGPYPYETLSIVQRSWPTSGGHSPASFVVLNELPRTGEGRLVPDPESPVELSRYREYAISHEIAHQWWGQSVTWERYRDQWLSEGLAQYAAARYIREKQGEGAYAAVLKRFSRWTERASDTGPITLGSRLSYLDFNAYQAIVYDKAALALMMLSDLLGEDVFFRGLREFAAAHKFRPARTAGFIRSLERASGRDLSVFFQGWFDSHLLPEVQAVPEVLKRGDEYVLKVRVSQTRGLFVFPLWISWTEGGAKVRRMLEIDSAEREFEIARPARPSRIKINPERLVPGKFR